MDCLVCMTWRLIVHIVLMSHAVATRQEDDARAEATRREAKKLAQRRQGAKGRKSIGRFNQRNVLPRRRGYYLGYPISLCFLCPFSLRPCVFASLRAPPLRFLAPSQLCARGLSSARDAHRSKTAVARHGHKKKARDSARASVNAAVLGR
jgi:hypothetical protein